MIDVDDICRDIVRKRNLRDNCPYGARATFDDLWEEDKEHLRETVRLVLESGEPRKA